MLLPKASILQSCYVLVVVVVPFITPNPWVMRHLALQTPHLVSLKSFGNSYGCWKCRSLKTTLLMSNYIVASVKQLQEATMVMKENLHLEELKCKQCSVAQKEPHDVKLERIKGSYSSCA